MNSESYANIRPIEIWRHPASMAFRRAPCEGTALLIAVMAMSIGLILFGCANVTTAQSSPEQNRAKRATAPPKATSEMPATRDRGTPLGARQEHVRRMVREFDDKLMELARELEQSQPEQVHRLVAALSQSKESLLERRMAKTAELLNRRAFDEAGGEQQRLVNDLKSLLAMLLAERRSEDTRREQTQLEAWTRELAQLLATETQERRQAYLASQREQAAAKLAARRGALESLLDDQQTLLDETAKPAADNVWHSLADKQSELQSRAASLAEQAVADPGALPQESAQLGQAARRQQQAEDALRDEDPRAARRQQQRAVEHLRSALEALIDNERQVRELSNPRLGALADAQEQAASQAAALGEAMSQPVGEHEGQSAADGDSQSDSSDTDALRRSSSAPDRGNSPERAVAKQTMDAAEQAMRKAAKKLHEKQPAEAEERESEAIDHLASLQDELLNQLAELQKATRDNKLAQLQSLFRDMLGRQQLVTSGTAEVERNRRDGKLRRADRLALGKLAADENSLAESAEETSESLARESGSQVFRRIIDHLQDDCRFVATELRQERSGAAVHARQTEIEETLKELLAALDDAKTENQSEDEQQPRRQPNDGESEPASPLLPAVAELRLLRSRQLRINERTAMLGKRDEAPTEETWRNALDDLVSRQSELARLAQEMAERAP